MVPKGRSETMTDARTLYAEDFVAWTQQQAEALRSAARESTNQRLDWENLAEEIEDLGKSVRHQLRNQLTRIQRHLIKLGQSPAKYPRRGWRESIREARLEIETLLNENPILKPELDRFAAEQLRQAIKLAAADLEDYGELDATGRSAVYSTSFTVDQILSDWLPPEPSRSRRRN
jgi:signal transduction histidine kinase